VCPWCRSEISSQATTCLHCGAWKQRNGSFRSHREVFRADVARVIVVTTILLVVLFGAVSLFLSTRVSTSSRMTDSEVECILAGRSNC
jgi:hypothetical protein